MTDRMRSNRCVLASIALTAALAGCSGGAPSPVIQVLEPCKPNLVFSDIAWSPDGKSILFNVKYVHNGNRTTLLATVNSDGIGGMKTLTDPGSPNSSGVWSADGKQIAFVSFRENTDPLNCSMSCAAKIYMMAADGHGQRRLFFDGSDSYRSLAWSPDGKQIAFGTYLWLGLGGIAVVNADGSGFRQLTQQDDDLPAWSPDGKQIAFGSTRNEDMRLYVMDADGSNQRMLDATPNILTEVPIWLPDGSGIAYPDGGIGYDDIMIAWLDGQRPTALLDEPLRYDADPAWSPDGKHVLFVSDQQKNIVQIFVADSNGSNVEQVTRGTAPNYEPTWSPDGARIAFVSQRDGGSEIYVMNADGSDQTRITSNPANQKCLHWPF